MMNTTKCACGTEIKGETKREMYRQLWQHKLQSSACREKKVDFSLVLAQSAALQLA